MRARWLLLMCVVMVACDGASFRPTTASDAAGVPDASPMVDERSDAGLADVATMVVGPDADRLDARGAAVDGGRPDVEARDVGTGGRATGGQGGAPGMGGAPAAGGSVVAPACERYIGAVFVCNANEETFFPCPVRPTGCRQAPNTEVVCCPAM